MCLNMWSPAGGRKPWRKWIINSRPWHFYSSVPLPIWSLLPDSWASRSTNSPYPTVSVPSPPQRTGSLPTVSQTNTPPSGGSLPGLGHGDKKWLQQTKLDSQRRRKKKRTRMKALLVQRVMESWHPWESGIHPPPTQARMTSSNVLLGHWSWTQGQQVANTPREHKLFWKRIICPGCWWQVTMRNFFQGPPPVESYSTLQERMLRGKARDLDWSRKGFNLSIHSTSILFPPMPNLSASPTHQDWPHLTENQEGSQLNVFTVSVLQRDWSKPCSRDTKRRANSRPWTSALGFLVIAWKWHGHPEGREVSVPCWGLQSGCPSSHPKVKEKD